MTELKPIPGFKRYFADRDGNIYSTCIYKTPTKMKPLKTQGGYLKITLVKGPKRTTQIVHRLVLAAFTGEMRRDRECNHKNGKRDDNRIDNLEWVTKSENERHAYDVLGKRINIGEDAPHAKLTENQVREILSLYKSGIKQSDICRKFQMSCGQICRIVHGTRWQHIHSMG